MKVFLDISALAKRYVEEVGSEEVRALCAEADADRRQAQAAGREGLALVDLSH
jgi:hypothetical protein